MIQAKVIEDSLNQDGDRLTTFEVVFPRIVLAEFNTHRMFSRNSASSRAIPFKKMVNKVKESPFIPIAFQKDHKGMQGTSYLTGKEADLARNSWLESKASAIEEAEDLHEFGVTKQICNRLLEPFMYHKVLITSSQQGLENFFKLRCPQYHYQKGTKSSRLFRSKKDFLYHSDSRDVHSNFKRYTNLQWLQKNESQAEIHIQALAECMWDAQNESVPKDLKAGEWHIPYSDNMPGLNDYMGYELDGNEESDEWFKDQVSIAKRKISVARCARISYQTLGDNPKIDYEADLKLYDRLASSGHWSPFEHVACAMKRSYGDYCFGIGSVANMDHQYDGGWCRNFKGFVQLRSIVD